MSEPRSYLGDGVYASMDAMGQIWCVTERDGRKERIAFEFQTFGALLVFAARVWDVDIQMRQKKREAEASPS